jgi:MbtH protein
MDRNDVWHVVMDVAGRYSVWRQGRPVPLRWSMTAFSGTRHECLAHIDTVWLTPQPLGWSRAMDSMAKAAGQQRPE